jgi:hypothetical protein
VLYVVLMAGLSAALWWSGLRTAAPAVHFVLALLLGFEAGTLRRWTLARRGWVTLGVVIGDDLESAERRFFDAWVKQGGGDERSVAPPPLPVPRGPARSGPDVIGLFPEPGAPR